MPEKHEQALKKIIKAYQLLDEAYNMLITLENIDKSPIGNITVIKQQLDQINRCTAATALILYRVSKGNKDGKSNN